jgi:hypothetical protein
MMAPGNCDPENAVHIPESSQINVKVFPGDRNTGRHVRFEVEIRPENNEYPVEFLNFEAAPGNARFKQVTVEIGERRPNSRGKQTSHTREVVAVSQVDLLELRKSFGLTTNN